MLVGWHIYTMKDVAPVNMNPRRSFYINARSLKINPTKIQLPVFCSWLAILCCHPLSAPALVTTYYLQSQTYTVGKSVSSLKTRMLSTILSFET